MEPYRERIEDFIRRYGYEGSRVFRVLAVAAVLAAAGVVSGSLQRAPTYEATAHVLLNWQQKDQWTNLAGSGEQIQTLEFREPVIQTMIPAIDSRPVAEDVI